MKPTATPLLAQLLLATLLWAGPAALAQPVTVNPGALTPPAPPSDAGPPATQYRPERVRTVLKSIHGFTREALDASSINVPDILIAFIDSADEPILVRRQAIKALGLYPSDRVLTFIESRIAAAARGQKQLYLSSLSPYAASESGRVSVVVSRMLEDPSEGVRNSAVSLAAKLEVRAPELDAQLRSRAQSDPSQPVRASIQKLLSKK